MNKLLLTLPLSIFIAGCAERMDITVNFPDYGYRSQAITGSCQVKEAVRPIVAQPYNITVANIQSNTGAGGGLLGMVVAGVANSIAIAANDETNDDFGYRPVSVQFPISEIE